MRKPTGRRSVRKFGAFKRGLIQVAAWWEQCADYSKESGGILTQNQSHVRAGDPA